MFSEVLRNESSGSMQSRSGPSPTVVGSSHEDSASAVADASLERPATPRVGDSVCSANKDREHQRDAPLPDGLLETLSSIVVAESSGSMRPRSDPSPAAVSPSHEPSTAAAAEAPLERPAIPHIGNTTGLADEDREHQSGTPITAHATSTDSLSSETFLAVPYHRARAWAVAAQAQLYGEPFNEQDADLKSYLRSYIPLPARGASAYGEVIYFPMSFDFETRTVREFRDWAVAALAQHSGQPYNDADLAVEIPDDHLQALFEIYVERSSGSLKQSDPSATAVTPSQEQPASAVADAPLERTAIPRVDDTIGSTDEDTEHQSDTSLPAHASASARTLDDVPSSEGWIPVPRQRAQDWAVAIKAYVNDKPFNEADADIKSYLQSCIPLPEHACASVKDTFAFPASFDYDPETLREMYDLLCEVHAFAPDPEPVDETVLAPNPADGA